MLFQALVVLLLIAAVLILAFAKAGGRLSVQRRSEPLRELDDFALETREIADHAGWEKRYTLRLPAVAGWGEELFVYLPHQYAQVWLGGEPAAASEEPDARHLGHSPGCYWLVLPVTEADSGAELTIVTQPCYRALADRDPRVLLASWDAVQGRLLGECLPEMLMSTICVVSGLLLVILAAALSASLEEKGQLVDLGAFTLSVGLWRWGDYQIAALLFPAAVGQLYEITMFGMLFSPLFFMRFLYWQRRSRGGELYRYLSWLFAQLVLVLLCLQLMNVYDLRAAGNGFFAAVAVAAVLVFIRSALDLLRGRAEPPQGLPAHAHRRSADGPRRDRHGGGADPAAPAVGGPAGPARLRLLSHARGRYGGAQQLPRRLYDALQLGRADRRQAAF